MRKFVPVLALMLALPMSSSQAQDPTEVDSGHYTVEFENDQVRVVRIKYGPGEKSVLHDHPDGVAVFLTDSKAKMTLPDGQVMDQDWKAGQATWAPGGKHIPENVGGQPFELVLVEIKPHKMMKEEMKEKMKEKKEEMEDM